MAENQHVAPVKWSDYFLEDKVKIICPYKLSSWESVGVFVVNMSVKMLWLGVFVVIVSV